MHNSVYKILRDKNKLIEILLMILIFLGLNYIFTPLINVKIHNFERIISNASSANFDSEKLIRKFLLFFIICIPIVYLIFHNFIKKIGIDFEKVSSKFYNIFVFFLFAIILNLFVLNTNKYKLNSIYLYSSVFIGFSLIFITFIYLKRFYINVSENTFKWCALFSLNSIFVISIFRLISNINFDFDFFRLDINFIFKTFVSSIIFVILFLLILNAVKNISSIEKVKQASIYFFAYPFFVWFLLELYMILNQNGIYFPFSQRAALIIAFFILLVLWYTKYKKTNYSEKKWENKVYPFFVISLVFISNIIPQRFYAYTDMFEQANYAASTSNFLLYDKIPLIETHGAHLLSDYIFNIMYGILNSDYIGSIFSPYVVLRNIFGIIVLYYIFRIILGEDNSFLFFLFAPIFFMDGSLFITNISLVSFLAYAFLLRNASKNASYYIYWIVLFLSLIYQGDFGLAFGASTILCTVIFSILKYDVVNIKKYFSSFFITSLFISIIFAIICLSLNINPKERFLEFAYIMAKSNQNWANPSIGDAEKFFYFLTYTIIPMICIFVLFYLIKTRENHVKIKTQYLLVISIGLSYFLNLQRILVRHSAAEGWIVARNMIGIVFIVLAIYILTNSMNKLLISFFLLTSICMIGETGNFISTNQFNVATSRFNYSYIDGIDVINNKKIQRCIIDGEMMRNFSPFVDEINFLLDEDETYLDFTNQSLYYSLSKRYNPVYVNQSPGMVCGDFSQKMFIKEIENSYKKVELAILPANEFDYFVLKLDGIMNSARYYLISEYIYNNFEPFETMGNFNVWCRKGDKDLLKRRIKAKNKEAFSVDIDDTNIDNLELKEVCKLPDEGISKDVIFKAVDDDHGLFKIEKLFDMSLLSEEDQYYELEISYKSDIEGLSELYYTNSNFSEFSENTTMKFNCFNDGVVKFIIKLNRNSKIRFDLPVNSNFIIKNIKLSKKENNLYDVEYFISKKFLDGYNDSYNEVLHNYDLGYIPYLWGSLDKKNAFDNKVLKEIKNIGYNIGENIDFEIKDLDLSKGLYLSFIIESDKENNCTVNLLNNDDIKVKFNFTAKEGKNKYLIRITSDYMLYGGLINKMRLDSESNLEVSDICLKEGD